MESERILLVFLLFQKMIFRFPTDSNGEESLTYLSYQTLTVTSLFFLTFFSSQWQYEQCMFSRETCMLHSSYSSSSPPSSAPSSPAPVPDSPLAGGLQGNPILLTPHRPAVLGSLPVPIRRWKEVKILNPQRLSPGESTTCWNCWPLDDNNPLARYDFHLSQAVTASLPQFVLQFSAYMLTLYLLEELKVKCIYASANMSMAVL